MQEYWFCAACKSMNRADAKRCYKCRAPKEEATLATTAHRQQGVVLTPGLDDDHRAEAWTLMSSRRYTSAWRLGYVAAGMLVITLALLAMLTAVDFVVLLAGGLFDQSRTATHEPDRIQVAIVTVVAMSLVAFLLLTLVVHSVFLGLTSMNSAALGSGTPRFGAVRAGLWWLEALGWTIWGVLCLSVILYLIAKALRILGGPISAITKPRRLLQDLMDRLGVPGSSDSRLVGYWSMAWGTARGINYAMSLAPLILAAMFLFIFTALSVTGLGYTPAPPGQVAFYATLLVVLLTVGELVADGVALFLLARITWELASRQRVREEWVVSGLHAGNMGQQPTAAQQPDSPAPVPYAPTSQPQTPVGWAPRPVDDPVVWSRQVERRVPQPWSAPIAAPPPAGALPEVLLRAIGQPAAGEIRPNSAQPSEPAPPLLRPSMSSLPRYGSPLDVVKPEPPAGEPPSELDMGGGI
jgi:hypothetical protein